jgi:hypothetical protein
MMVENGREEDDDSEMEEGRVLYWTRAFMVMYVFIVAGFSFGVLASLVK